MAADIILDLLLQARSLLDLVYLRFVEQLQVLEHQTAHDLLHSLMFVRARLQLASSQFRLLVNRFFDRRIAPFFQC